VRAPSRRRLTPRPALPRRLHLLPCAPRKQEDFGPQLTFLGLPTDDDSDPPGQDWLVELLGAPEPANLYNAFRATAGARLAAVS
jgi:hypothetical protein